MRPAAGPPTPPPPPPHHRFTRPVPSCRLWPVVCILLILWPWPGQAPFSASLSPSTPRHHSIAFAVVVVVVVVVGCSAANDTSSSTQPRSLGANGLSRLTCCSPRIDLTRPSIHLKDPTTLVSPSLPLALPLPRPSRKLYIVGSACTRLVLLGFHFYIRAFSELHNSPRRPKLVNT